MKDLLHIIGGKKEREVLLKKISYVKLFKPWGWIIGMGEYMDDIEKAKAQYKNNFRSQLNKIFITCLGGSVLLFILILTGIYIFLRNSLKNPLNNLVAFATEVSQGNLDKTLSGRYVFEFKILKNAIEKNGG